MKVLLLHQHFNTPQKGGAVRSYYLAKALVDAGIETTVITAHNSSEHYSEVVEGINVHYLPVPYDNRYGFLKRSVSFVRFVIGSIRLSAKHQDKILCYAISTPLTVGIAARWIKRLYGIPYVFEVGDLWPEAPIQLGIVKNKILQRVLQQLERTIYKDAEAIVALSPAIKKAVQEKMPRKVVHLIPNMADTDFFKPESKKPELERRFNTEGKFVVSYIGAIGYANGLDYFLECARASQRAGLPIHFIMCGDGAQLEMMTILSQNLQLKNLLIIPFQNRDGVAQVMNITDATFICYRNVPVLETGSPNKYFDGLAAGKLIILNFGGWIREEIESAKCGIYTDPKNPLDFVSKIQPFLSSEQLLNQYQMSGRNVAEEKYSRKLLGGQFAQIISKATTD